SATEVLRVEVARSEDLGILSPALLEARAHIAEGAGPDRRVELARLENAVAVAQRAIATEDSLRDQLAEHRGRLEGLQAELRAVRRGLPMPRRRAVVAGLERDVSSSQSKIDQLAVDCHRAAPAARQA